MDATSRPEAVSEPKGKRTNIRLFDHRPKGVNRARLHVNSMLTQARPSEESRAQSFSTRSFDIQNIVRWSPKTPGNLP
jgi:hypothetical protein